MAVQWPKQNNSVFSQNSIHQNLKRSPRVLQMGKAKEGHKCYLK